jgi:hypothetical protein
MDRPRAVKRVVLDLAERLQEIAADPVIRAVEVRGVEDVGDHRGGGEIRVVARAVDFHGLAPARIVEFAEADRAFLWIFVRRSAPNQQAPQGNVTALSH